MQNKSQNIRKNTGISLLETVIYLGILAIVSVFVINTLLLMFSTYNDTKVKKRIALEGAGVMERLVREIRLANSVDDGGSTLGTNSSHLKLNTVASWTDGTATTKEIYIQGSNLVFKEGVGSPIDITSSKTSVSVFRLDKITTARSEALKIELVISAPASSGQINSSFYNSVILRGGY